MYIFTLPDTLQEGFLQTPFQFRFLCATGVLLLDSLDGVRVQNDSASARADIRPASSAERRRPFFPFTSQPLQPESARRWRERTSRNTTCLSVEH